MGVDITPVTQTTIPPEDLVCVEPSNVEVLTQSENSQSIEDPSSNNPTTVPTKEDKENLDRVIQAKPIDPNLQVKGKVVQRQENKLQPPGPNYEKVATINVGDRFASIQEGNSPETVEAAKKMSHYDVSYDAWERDCALFDLGDVKKVPDNSPTISSYDGARPTTEERPSPSFSNIPMNEGSYFRPINRALYGNFTSYPPLVRETRNQAIQAQTITIATEIPPPPKTFHVILQIFDVSVPTMGKEGSYIEYLLADGTTLKKIPLKKGDSQIELDLPEGSQFIEATAGRVGPKSDGKKDEFDNFRVEIYKEKEPVSDTPSKQPEKT